MNIKIRAVVLDFIFGGVIVAGALLIASLLGPVYGGILAGAPIRAGGTIFLEYLHRGEASASGLTGGVLAAMIANVGFAAVLYFGIPRIGLPLSFVVASMVFVIVAAPLILLLK